MSLAETLFNSIFKKGVGPGTIRVLNYVIVALILSIGFAFLTGEGNVHLYVLLFLSLGLLLSVNYFASLLTAPAAGGKVEGKAGGEGKDKPKKASKKKKSKKAD